MDFMFDVHQNSLFFGGFFDVEEASHISGRGVGHFSGTALPTSRSRPPPKMHQRDASTAILIWITLLVAFGANFVSKAEREASKILSKMLSCFASTD